MTSNTHPFYDTNEIKKNLIEFKSIDWTGKVFADVIDEYKSRFSTFPAYEKVLRKGTILFRGAKNNNDEDFTTVKRLGIAEERYIKSFGRANIPNVPVMYLCNNEETVIQEVTQWYINEGGRAQDLVSKGVMRMGWNPFTAMMTISAWQIIEDIKVAVIFNGDSKLRCAGIQEAEKNEVEPKTNNPSFVKSCNLIIDFFSKEFANLKVSHEMEYLLSALYSYGIMHKSGFDGVQYASIANNLRGENIALSQKGAEKLKFLGANFCYTYNTLKKPIQPDKICLMGRIKSALLQPDLNTLVWVDSTDEYDYIVFNEGQYLPLLLHDKRNKENMFSKAATRI